MFVVFFYSSHYRNGGDEDDAQAVKDAAAKEERVRLARLWVVKYAPGNRIDSSKTVVLLPRAYILGYVVAHTYFETPRSWKALGM